MINIGDLAKFKYNGLFWKSGDTVIIVDKADPDISEINHNYWVVYTGVNFWHVTELLLEKICGSRKFNNISSNKVPSFISLENRNNY